MDSVIIDYSKCPFCNDRIKEHSQDVFYCDNKNCKKYFQFEKESFIFFMLQDEKEASYNLSVNIYLEEGQTSFLMTAKNKQIEVSEIFDPWKAEDLERIKEFAERWKKMSVFD